MGEWAEIIRSFLEVIDRLADLDQPGWRVLSLIVSPIVALIALYYNLKSRRELEAQAGELGSLEERVRTSQEQLKNEAKRVEDKNDQVTQQASEINKLQNDIELLTERSHELWKIRPAAPFAELRDWQRDPRGARVVAFGNLKGGVGKTTLAANFGSYIVRELDKPVLYVDLDFQASLSNLLIQSTAGAEVADQEIESRINKLFADNPSLVSIQEAMQHLAPTLSRGWLVPASYQFAQFENQLLMRQLLLKREVCS